MFWLLKTKISLGQTITCVGLTTDGLREYHCQARNWRGRDNPINKLEDNFPGQDEVHQRQGSGRWKMASVLQLGKNGCWWLMMTIIIRFLENLQYESLTWVDPDFGPLIKCFKISSFNIPSGASTWLPEEFPVTKKADHWEGEMLGYHCPLELHTNLVTW